MIQTKKYKRTHVTHKEAGLRPPLWKSLWGDEMCIEYVCVCISGTITYAENIVSPPA